MKLPDLSKLKPAPKASSRARPQVKVPAPVEDIYRDMRDRRLLLPVLALVIAIIAVPVALSASREEPPEPAAFVIPAGAEEVAPAVLADSQLGVRDYRDRLEELKSKNPFKQRFLPTAAEIVEATELTETPTAPSSEPVNAPAPVPSSDPPPASGSKSSSPTPTTQDEPERERVTVVLAPRIDVMAGPAGATREMNNQEFGDLIPSKKQAPVAMFIGVSENLKSAHFAISDGVTDTKGDGACRPKPSDCEFLKLGLGKRRSFFYEPNATRYVIKIKAIREVVIERRKSTVK